MATHSSVLAWKIPWTGEPGGLPSMGSHRVGHERRDLAAAAAAAAAAGVFWKSVRIREPYISGLHIFPVVQISSIQRVQVA